MTQRVVLCFPLTDAQADEIDHVSNEIEVINAGQSGIAKEILSADVFMGHAKVPLPWQDVVDRLPQLAELSPENARQVEDDTRKPSYRFRSKRCALYELCATPLMPRMPNLDKQVEDGTSVRFFRLTFLKTHIFGWGEYARWMTLENRATTTTNQRP